MILPFSFSFACIIFYTFIKPFILQIFARNIIIINISSIAISNFTTPPLHFNNKLEDQFLNYIKIFQTQFINTPFIIE